MKLYSKEMQKQFPQKQGHHIHDDVLEKDIDEFIDNGVHADGVSLLRILHWNWKLNAERCRHLSEQLHRPEEYHQINPDSVDEFNTISSIARQKLHVDIKNALYLARHRGGKDRDIPYDEIVSIIDGVFKER